MATLFVIGINSSSTREGFASLEDAVNAAQPGDIIELDTGYVRLESTDTDGYIDIRKDLTIVGAGKGETILRAERPTEKCMIGVVGTACVTFMDFTLDGNDGSPNDGVNVFAGITFIENSTGVIGNMEIKNIGEDSLDVETGMGGAGRGIFLLDNAHVTVSGTDFSGNERDDILARGTSTVIINGGSTFTADLADASREYGVRARHSAAVDVSNSTFTGT